MDGTAVKTATEQTSMTMEQFTFLSVKGEREGAALQNGETGAPVEKLSGSAEQTQPQEASFERYLRIAEQTGVFAAREIEVLREVLADSRLNPHTTYQLLDEYADGHVAGFVIFGKTPMTDFSWDIYWLVVAKDFQGKGFGKRLLKRMEEHLRHIYPKALLRLETSTKREHTIARGLYLKEGFQEMGRIPHFYGEGDDLIIFYKEIGPEIAHSSKAG